MSNQSTAQTTLQQVQAILAAAAAYDASKMPTAPHPMAQLTPQLLAQLLVEIAARVGIT